MIEKLFVGSIAFSTTLIMMVSSYTSAMHIESATATTEMAEKVETTTEATVETTTEKAAMTEATVETTTEKAVTAEAIIETTTEKEVPSTTVTKRSQTAASSSEALYTPRQFKINGVLYYNGWRWTWYSQRVLPGPGLKIPGRHIDEQGYVCDENDYICLASSVLSKGTVVDTPLGKQGKVYDSGCATDTLDVYVDW